MATTATQLATSRAHRTLAICGVVALHVAILAARAPDHSADVIPEHRAIPDRGKVFVALEPMPNPSPPAPRKSNNAGPATQQHTQKDPAVVEAPGLAMLRPEPAGAPTTAPASETSSQPAAATAASTPDTSASDADYSRNPPPPYPPISRRMREQGQVMLSVLVTPEGTVKEAAIEKSSGYARLDQAALDAVRDWVFVPAKRAGIAVLSRVKVPVNFVLR